MENSDGLKEMFSTYMREDEKHLAFCTSQEHLTKIMEGAKEWFPEGTHLYKYYANLRSSKEYDDFIRNNDKGIKVLLSIEMLNEGIHNPDVDGYIMFRPTESHIIYLQQLGHVLHVNGEKKPQVFDIVNNAASLTVLESGFKERNGSKKEPRENDITFIITPKQRDIMRIISDIKEALDDPLEYRYTECLEYGTNVRYKNNEGLYRWLHAQRILYANDMLEQRKSWAWIGKSTRPPGIVNIDWGD